MNINDILAGVPVNAVLRERLILAKEKQEFEVTKASNRAETAEASAVNIQAQLENEKKEHAITRASLVEALKQIERLAGQSKAVKNMGFDGRIPKFNSFK